jgi:hypothetical protein
MANLFLREPLDHQNAISLPLLQEGNTGVVQRQTADLHGWCIHDFEIFSSLPSTFFFRSIENRR